MSIVNAKNKQHLTAFIIVFGMAVIFQFIIIPRFVTRSWTARHCGKPPLYCIPVVAGNAIITEGVGLRNIGRRR